MIILEHSTYDASNIAENLGAAEYSYWFVRKAFRPLLARFGTVVPIAVPQRDAPAHLTAAKARCEDAVLLSYNPPHYTPIDLPLPVVPVFAWEFDRIPDESWNANALNDWRVTLAHTGCAVTHCSATVRAVQQAMGLSYPVWAIPAPIKSRHLDRWQGPAAQLSIELQLVEALALDVSAIDLQFFRQGYAVGVRALRVLHHAATHSQRTVQNLSLQGIVYTAVFNPADGRKNWEEMVTAFVWGLRHNNDATLVLKLTHSDIEEAMQPILEHIAKLGRFVCRIVLIHGFLTDRAYAQLIHATCFALNTSSGEGQCLPLMEFMAAGRPAVAPLHSAMLDYVSPDNSFIVSSRPSPSCWPHDGRQATRCFRQEIVFEDLVQKFRQSYRVAKADQPLMSSMAEAASTSLDNFCSLDVLYSRLSQVFRHLAQVNQSV